MTELITIDGSQGEGGGQILRTCLTLSLLSGRPVELINIRAGRKKPGLLRQHLTALRAASEISDAVVKGDVPGSQRVLFTPGKVKPGDYRFAIGSAGSTVLVCQTVLLPLILSGARSRVTFEGGTHNAMAPSLTFFQESFMPVLKMMGARYSIETESLGFNPAGGGKWVLEIQPKENLRPVHLRRSVASFEQENQNRHIRSIVGLIPKSVAEREIQAVRKKLYWFDAEASAEWVKSRGTGNSLHLKVQCEGYATLFESTGQPGVSAERVANRTSQKLKAFLSSGAAVEEHLADQLLLPLFVAGEGSFTTSAPSDHTLTNARIIRLFTGHEFLLEKMKEKCWRVSLNHDFV